MSVEVESQILTILQRYGISVSPKSIERIGSGYIHFTYMINGIHSYILQRINKNVFKDPEIIATNIDLAARYLRSHFPEFLFMTPEKTKEGNSLVYASDGFPWRLFPYIENSITIDKVTSNEQAYSAAVEFARLSKNLDGIDVSQFKPTIDRFHDLSWRYEQFQHALAHCSAERKIAATHLIDLAHHFHFLVNEYNDLTQNGQLKLRITHNDTKINNILFDQRTGRALCAIDLDTLMPGYFIYDLGDMIRTFVSPVDEDEQDTSKILVRKEIYDAVVNGYLSQMGSILNDREKSTVHFSGLMMTYIMALRFLADFLNGNVYYQVRYEDHNLIRAANQFALLQQLEAMR
jgi:thiamine kinase-like enzyme